MNFSQRVQFDGFHCGAWCVFVAEEYFNFCRSDADPSCVRITNPLVKSDTVALEDHMENTRFIRRWRELGTLGERCCLGSLPCYNMDVSATCRTIDWAVVFTNGLGRSARTPFMGNSAQGSFSVIPLTPESSLLSAQP